MTFTWTDKMKNVGASKDLEAPTRQAVITAVELWGKLPVDAKDAPRFDGGHFLNPANDAAKMLVAAMTDHLDPMITGRTRATIITTAVALASIACAQNRRGDAAWQRLAEALLPKGAKLETPAEPAVAQPTTDA